MSFVSCRPARRGAMMGCATLLLATVGPSGAWAQCNDTISITNPFPPPASIPGSQLYPLSQGAAISSIISSINAANTAFLTGTSAFVSAPGGPRPDQQGGGAWGRVIGGSVENSNTSVTTPTSTLLGLPVTGSATCDTKTQTDFRGFQVGHDISILNGGGTGANWHWGVTAGYFEADSKDKTFGSFSGNVQVPFAGIYTAYTKGNLGLDAQARWDYYSNTVTDATNGLFGQRFDGFGFSLTGNAAYNIPLRNNWFIEPSIGAIWSRVQLDPLNVPGTFVLATSPFFGAPGTVQIQDIESLLGRVSLSVGTTFQSGHVTWQPFFTASVFHEFMDDVTTNVTTSFQSLNVGFTPADEGTATIKTSRVGTYGQFAVGTAAVLGNTGWLGYGRFDYRTGENIDGWSLNAGLRYQFDPGPGRRSIKDGPATAAWDTYNWTGPYLGGFAGKVHGTQDWFTAGIGTNDDPEFGGYLAGGQVGYNVQLGRWVLGVEADYGFANARGGKSCQDSGSGDQFFFTCEAELDRLATVTGRVGYTWGRALFYAKGGFAAGEVTVQTFFNPQTDQVLFITPTVPFVNGETKWLTGWTIGGGMEFALSQRWSAKAEYMHFDLGSKDFAIDNGLVAEASAKGDTVRIGVNYHLHAPREERPLK